MRDPGQSILFTRYQNPALAAEAREMSLAFADFSYLRWVTGEEDPERAWEMYFAHTQPQVRNDLDGLLKTFHPEDHDRAIKLAGSVEAFVLPSRAIESRVFVNPGEATGYLIGISPLLADLTAEIAWGMHLVLPYTPEALPSGWEVAAMHAQGTLDLTISAYVRTVAGIGEAPPFTGALGFADEVGGVGYFGQRPRDYRAAAVSFALAHELTHIQQGDVFLSEEEKERNAPAKGVIFPPVSDEEHSEVAADAATFTHCFNYLLLTWIWRQEPPADDRSSQERFMQDAKRRLAALGSAVLATEVCESYYAAILILAVIAESRGDNDSVDRCLTVAKRLPYVQSYIQRTRKEALAPSYGPFMWTDRDVEYRKAHHRWRVRFIEDVMPHILQSETRDLAEAVDAQSELLTVQERVLGPDHPDTLATMCWRARLRGETGDAAGVAAAYAEMLTVQERVLGPDHPDTLTARHNVAHWRGEAGDAAGAAAAYAELLTVQERVLGPDHPDTLATRGRIAIWRGRAGDAAGAAAAWAEQPTSQERVLEPDHPDTLATLAARGRFAHWRGEAGNAAGAAAAYAELLTVQERVLGPDHPDTLATRHNVAHWWGEAGDVAGAAAAWAEMLTVQERVLGPDHPDTLTARHNVAHWRGEAGDAAGAAAALAEMLTVQERVLGPDHPETLATRGRLADCQRRGDGEDPAVG
ncbi:tetratricopeptide repeat protein [Streptomyces xiamenensis]|uniref:tetratricopeptide repeat protein n=1 Tax=Streptomyces xiamenensis TaxID=408015 RepID=UPI0035DAB542